MDNRSQRLAVITGGSSGIGRSTARLFVERGWRVAIIARGEAALGDVQAELGESLHAYQADVADDAALREAARRIVAELGPFDVWVNNAGISVFGRFDQLSEEEFRRVTDVTYVGTVNGTRVALEHMRPRGTGTVVNVCSAIGLRGMPLQSAYSGAKWAMRGFSEAVRAELLSEGSRVQISLVYPPSVNTPFYEHAPNHDEGSVPRPPPPVYQPERIAAAILRAATGRHRDILVGSQTVVTGLLNTVAPELSDRLLARFAPALQRTRRGAAEVPRDENLFTASTRPAPERGPFGRFGTVGSGIGAGVALGAVLIGLAALAPPRRD